ncbi:MAG: fimbrillin family protein [Dysgonamonadaceae bacterium]|jgi:hypothetical protein|nr:fimbrillin family protein [Dysgonamonadaceae bacterium]
MSLLAIAGLWVACSSDETLNNENREPISFRVQGGAPSLRATGTTLGFVNAFVVNAYGDVTGIPTATPPSVATMNGVTVYREENNTTDVFDYNPKLYYHSADSKVYFSAYSPISKSVNSGLKNDPNNKIDYTVIVPDKTNGNTSQEDLLVAYTAQNDLSGTTKVTLNFKHALSRVYVKATNETPETVVIKELKLVNLYNRGELKIDATSWNVATNVDINEAYKTTIATVPDYKKLWTPTGSQNNSYQYVLPASGVAVPAGTKTRTFIVSKEQGMMILPQTTISSSPFTEATDFYLEVKYKLSNIEETVKIPFKDLNNLSATGLTFEFGRQYALNIDFKNVAIEFTVTVEDWNTPEVDLPLP